MVKVKLKPHKDPTDDVYANLPLPDRREVIVKEKVPDHVVKIDTNHDDKAGQKKDAEKGVTIECQRLNRNKVLEKINVEVSQGVFEALKDMNPQIQIRNTLSRSWNSAGQNSGDFLREKSVQEVKSAIQWLKSLKSCNKYKLSKPKVTSL